MLLEQLPGDSAYKTAVRDALTDDDLAALAKREPDKHGPWSHEALRLAAIEDLLKWLIYATYAAQGAKPKEPQPTPRPGVATAKRRALSDEGLAYLQKLRDDHEREHGYGIGAPPAGAGQSTSDVAAGPDGG